MTSPEGPTAGALLRFITSRLDVPAVALFRLAPTGGAALWSATDAFRHEWSRQDPGRPADLPRLPDTLGRALVRAKAVRVDPAAFGLLCDYAVVRPILVDGTPRAFFLFLSGRRRWLGPAAAAAMQDAADILAEVIARRDEFPTPEAGEGSGVPPAAEDGAAHLPHGEALALVDDLPPAGEGRGKALLILDIDRFHALNEALGAGEGDFLLARLSERLFAAIGPDERMARLGGDRFIFLTRRCGASLEQFAARLLKLVSEPLCAGGEPVRMHATIGLVTAPPGDCRSPDMLFMQAYKALRRGKADGGKRVCAHDAAYEARQRERSRLEVDLGAAIRADQLRLVYQPYVNLADGSVAGVEALLRWQHPGRGELTPASFLNLAEISGQILPIGSWVLREALCRASEWPDAARLSVNVSALQFQQPDFIAQIDRALAQSGFPAERLELEITETVQMRDNPETIGMLRTLIARGIRIALDDFGTGYSALSYLARLPHHRIKLDKEFVDDLENPATHRVIQAIVSSARAQGITVTAEGIETNARLEQVRRMGFTHAQGFLIGTPVEDPAAYFDRRSGCATV